MIERIDAVEQQLPTFQALLSRLCQTDQRARTQPDVPPATLAAVFPLKAEYPATASIARDLKIDAVPHGIAPRLRQFGNRERGKWTVHGLAAHRNLQMYLQKQDG